MASDSEKPTDFSATDSALGYLYQVRLALLSSMRRLARDASFTVYLETLDDVVFEEAGSAVELLQLKHHRERAANLTDSSPDLWKTLRVWMEGRANATISTDGQLFLVTTSAVGDGSAASMLLVEDRDVDEAVKRLSTTATTSTSNTNEPAYKLFRGMTEDEPTSCSQMRLPSTRPAPRSGKKLDWQCAASISTRSCLASRDGGLDARSAR